MEIKSCLFYNLFCEILYLSRSYIIEEHRRKKIMCVKLKKLVGILIICLGFAFVSCIHHNDEASDLAADGSSSRGDLQEEDLYSDLVAKNFVPERVHFDFDKSFVKEEYLPALQNLAEHMKVNRQKNLNVEGHCDSRGTDEYNLALGQRRAASIREYLVSLGVEHSRISAVSYGGEKLLVRKNVMTREDHATNRRADFSLN